MKRNDIILNGCICFFAIIFFWCCSKESNDADIKSGKELLGSWEWLKTIEGGFSQEVSSPATEGYSSTIQFLLNDSVKYYTNSTFTISYHYKLVYFKFDFLNPASDSTLVLQIDNGSKTFFRINQDTLILSQAYIDGPTIYYLKEKN